MQHILQQLNMNRETFYECFKFPYQISAKILQIFFSIIVVFGSVDYLNH